ncbi:MAG: DUF2207 domain-containing protein [bacterium]|nr:DUF2207 domain-containing protein [bacterium]
MKNKFLFLLVLLAMPITVFATNHIYNIDINIYLNEDGSAKISEVWNVNGSDGTEWYKSINGLSIDRISDFKVYRDGNLLKQKNWDVDESLSQKKDYYGINYTDSGLELCWGKYDYKAHKFTVNYTISDFIVNVEDAQVLDWTLIPKLSNVDFDNFSVTVSGYYEFPDTLDVWGTGYKGYAYVENGKIKMSNDKNMNDSYVVLLVKFPLNTFTTNKMFGIYSNFDEVLKFFNEGTYEYDYDNNSFDIDFIIEIIIALVLFLPAILINISLNYGYKDNKKIDKKNTNMYRDIPCNKDIYYAQTLIKLNNFSFYKETSIFGAIILKWVKEDKIRFLKDTTGKFDKETTKLDLTLNPTFELDIEKELFDIMYKASKDGILESKELTKWCENNYTKFFKIFSDKIDDNIKFLKSNGEIRKRKNIKECKKINVMSDKIYEDSSKLFGLKMFLDEFSQMKDKEVIEVKMWDEYLMFAYLFGIADKVAKQLKDLYPEVITQMEQSGYDYNIIFFVNDFSLSCYDAASSARIAAQGYSSGGGGFSSGGGGGGSFGGGGGGSR